MSLTEDDLAYLATVTVTVAPGRSLDVVTLVRAWRSHLATFEADLFAAGGGRPVRGAHDYIAALCFRDWIAQATALLPEDLRRALDRTVAEIDRRFSGVHPARCGQPRGAGRGRSRSDARLVVASPAALRPGPRRADGCVAGRGGGVSQAPV